MSERKSNSMTPVKDNIIKILDRHGFDYQKISHAPVLTMEEAEKACGHTAQEGIKTLLLKYDGVLFLGVVRGDHKVDFEIAKDIFKAKKVSMAKEDDLWKINVPTGALSPFGYELSMPVLLDKSIEEVDDCYINPGTTTETFKLKSSDLIKAIKSWSGDVRLF